MLHRALDLLVRAAGSRPHSFSLLTSFEARSRTCDRDENSMRRRSEASPMADRRVILSLGAGVCSL